MSPKYLVGSYDSQFGERDFKLIESSNEREAIQEFIRRFGIKDSLFLEHVYDRSMNMSLAERFWFQGHEEHMHLIETGRATIDENEFSARVRRFFETHSDFADLYLEHYFNDEEHESIEDKFPEEMKVYVWENSNWSNIAAIDLDDIEDK